MREIKFRAWDKDHNKMLSLTQIWWMDRDWLKDSNSEHTLRLSWINERGFSYWRDCKPSQIELMQFTGLKDKNGKEIYESDVIKWTSIHGDSPKEHIDTMRWENDYACFMLMPFVHKPHAAVMEVIGNIYENPELLTPTP